jgi:hypothetical protein
LLQQPVHKRALAAFYIPCIAMLAAGFLALCGQRRGFRRPPEKTAAR